MEKINILVCPNDKAGSGKFRCVDPHVKLQNLFPDDFLVDIVQDFDFNDINRLKKYNAVFIHKLPNNSHVDAENVIKNIKKLGLKVIIDLDDYWQLDYTHHSYQLSKYTNTPKVILNCVKLCDAVTVPTKIFANEIRKYNKNVFVLPNSIDPSEEQFKPNKTESDFIRFGWLGGSSHLKDLELLISFGAAQKSLGKKVQYVLCGFDTNGYVQSLNPNTGEMTRRQMHPRETVWFSYENILTDRYQNLSLDPEYVKFLLSFEDNTTIDTSNKLYRRIWTKPISSYAKGYNNFDISLSPLVDNTFNLYKSQLKIIEAGFHKKAIIAQNYGPYTLDLINYDYDNKTSSKKGNSLLVDTKKNHKQWVKHAKFLVNNPNLIEDIGENLYESVINAYDLNIVTKKRAEIYKNLIK